MVDAMRVLSPNSVTSIRLASEYDSGLEAFVRQSFDSTGINIAEEQQFFLREPNYYTVSVYSEEYGGLDTEGAVLPSTPMLVYQVGLYEDIKNLPPILQERYILDSNMRDSIDMQIKDFLGTSWEESVRAAFITRLGTNTSIHNLPRYLRRLKLGKWLRDSMESVTNYPPINLVDLVLFETTKTRARAFEQAIGVKCLNLGNLGGRFNREGFPLEAVLNDDYITLNKKYHCFETNLFSMRQALKSFILQNISATVCELKMPIVQQTVWQNFVTSCPQYHSFAEDYLVRYSVDRACLYFFENN